VGVQAVVAGAEAVVVAARRRRQVELGLGGLVLLLVQHVALHALAQHVQVVVLGLRAGARVGRETDAERHVLALVLGDAHKDGQGRGAARRLRRRALVFLQILYLG